jgi:branched-chain amino acid transport system substrate-binding protein
MLPAGKIAIYDALPKSDVQFKLLKEYDHSYRKAYGSEASTFGGYAYDAFLLATGAIKTVGSAPEQVRNGIEKANGLVSISGVFTMSPKDHNGLDLSAFEMVKVVKGDWVMIK